MMRWTALALVAACRSSGGGGGDAGPGPGAGPDGRADPIREHCPCPAGSYCDLASDTCVDGCLGDGECDDGFICDGLTRMCLRGCRGDGGCAAGEVCDELVCRPGCERDADCPAAGDICDAFARACRPGCRSTDECPLETVCDTASGAYACEPGCAGDDRCRAGRICAGGGCVDGCRVHEDCPLGQVCVEEQCIDGCGIPGSPGADWLLDRCPVGTACIASGCAGAGCAHFDCTAECETEFGGGAICRDGPGQDYVCFPVDGWSPHRSCLLGCSYDGDCPAGQICHDALTGLSDPPRLCYPRCTADAECAEASYDLNRICTCDEESGRCEYSGWECQQEAAP